jgi:hypothetical protein
MELFQARGRYHAIGPESPVNLSRLRLKARGKAMEDYRRCLKAKGMIQFEVEATA